MPVEAHIKEHPAWFHRFDVLWTPTVLILDSKGAERHRIEGYLPTAEFRAQLELGLARVAFMSKKWADAEKYYAGIVQHYPQSAVAAEAQYWAGVSRYKATNDHAALGAVAAQFHKNYSDSVWAKKASIWA